MNAAADELVQRVKSWIQGDVDPEDRATLNDLLVQMSGADQLVSQSARHELRSRFSGPLRFGTAGLRGEVGAGESRMNRATIVRTTAGLADALAASVDSAITRGVVLGRDARRGSAAFQQDAARVLAAKGFKVWFLPDTVPTPVVPFSVLNLNAAAGIMITASHNPGPDNGYKVYWDDGAQIAHPIDELIATAIEAQPAPVHIMQAVEEVPSTFVERPDLLQKYLASIEKIGWVPDAPVQDLRIVYTPLHGVGGAPFVEICRRRGIGHVSVVKDQFDPDPAFPTVSFPNPEEPEAMNMALHQADTIGADLAVANDPDADRLAVAVKDGASGWHVLSGNEVGGLLAHHILTHDEPNNAQRLVVNTLVSSRLLRQMAMDMGAQYEETLTGFKHIAKAMISAERRGLRAVFGYEEALGYAVSPMVRDKDGISAGLLTLELAAILKANGQTLLDQLSSIYRKYGLWLAHNWSTRLEGLDGFAQIEGQMSRFRSAPRAFLEAMGTERLHDLSQSTPAIPLMFFELQDGGRLSVRPSGTEPKLKFYLERRMEWPPNMTYADARKAASDKLRASAAMVMALATGTFSPP